MWFLFSHLYSVLSLSLLFLKLTSQIQTLSLGFISERDFHEIDVERKRFWMKLLDGTVERRGMIVVATCFFYSISFALCLRSTTFFLPFSLLDLGLMMVWSCVGLIQYATKHSDWLTKKPTAVLQSSSTSQTDVGRDWSNARYGQTHKQWLFWGCKQLMWTMKENIRRRV